MSVRRGAASDRPTIVAATDHTLKLDLGGAMVAKCLRFCRVLRGAGFSIGSDRVLDAIDAVCAVGVVDRNDFHWTLRAVLVSCPEQRDLFDRAFHLFWRNPELLDRLVSVVMPDWRTTDEARRSGPPGIAELIEPFLDECEPSSPDPDAAERDFAMGASERECLQSKDFENMSPAELAQAKDAIAAMRLPLAKVPTRRFRRHSRGERIDTRASLRAGLRAGSDTLPLVRQRRHARPPPLVVICDISGSMSRYSRMLLHFIHALTRGRERVFSFVFGTRLTNITRHVREKDVDVALERVAEAVEDWSGGTRIGRCLHEFNAQWSRRVLSRGAMVLFISDGLDRDAGTGLAREIERLHKSCRRLLWLNPLLRYVKFEPRSLGMQAIVPHVDQLRTIHNLDGLEELTAVLGTMGHRKLEGATVGGIERRY